MFAHQIEVDTKDNSDKANAFCLGKMKAYHGSVILKKQYSSSSAYKFTTYVFTARIDIFY